MMPRRALPPDGARALAELPKRRPVCRLRRHFFAAAAIVLVANPLPEPLPGSAARLDPASRPAPEDIRPGRLDPAAPSAPGSRDSRRLLVVDGVIAFTSGLDIRRVETARGGPEKQAAATRIGGREAYIVLLLAIANARQRVWLNSGYFVSDERLLKALGQAARRGVDVRLVLPGAAASWAPFHAGRACYGELLGAGVRIFERRDALRRIGSAGAHGIWAGATVPALPGHAAGYESDLIAIDRRLARQLEQLFQLDQAAAHEVSLTEWRRRGLASRLKEWLARCWERLL